MGPDVSPPFWQASRTNRALTARRQDGINASDLAAYNLIHMERFLWMSPSHFATNPPRLLLNNGFNATFSLPPIVVWAALGGAGDEIF